MDLDLVRQLAIPNDTKILLVVIDGLGGLPYPDTGRSELEAADTPHLDRLAAESACGLTIPVAPGVTPGSGPGHLALFGYDPLTYTVGRGVLEALGIDFELQPQDVASRGNFCTLDGEGRISDRRAGRISTEEAAKRCERLRDIELPGVQIFVEAVREHRFVVILRPEGGAELSDALADTDPQREGVEPLEPRALTADAEPTALLVARFVSGARERLAGQEPANGLTLRGFARHPTMPYLPEVLQLRAGAIAAYPMYRGLAKLVGMTVLTTGTTFDDEVETLRQHWDEFDFMFIHYKPADTAGEDGDFQAKSAALEAFDAALPRLIDMAPDVLMIAGDHSTPALMAGHSWHPVPFLMRSSRIRPDDVDMFDERSCRHGSFGLFPAKDALSLAMAHAGRLAKYGA
ncbi:MAG: 2,3-bisphosphoglycerate-independent phosphoglycerate mutase [Dehalococcoidia bacterium]